MHIGLLKGFKEISYFTNNITVLRKQINDCVVVVKDMNTYENKVNVMRVWKRKNSKSRYKPKLIAYTEWF